ncbi:glycosyltransferase family 4 protein [Acinetobacter indicus]|uniref:glycosyltransferase family 4 protein n=1 Tax=Acinetobacter indicus TaxID=756892 RepID=UPI0025781194|nr:glycosyltransferase family 4 protein [Acinetobacter indicus]MDM1276171.1 glycosyltransferase family 4 protein [Acinetobacter indicus]
MKVAFFQPYLANWRITFLTRFIENTKHEVIVYDGGFSSKKDEKSVTNNNAVFEVKKLSSLSPVLKFKGQNYPFYFSPFLFFNLIKDRPDVIITEGEINFINNISIFLYCLIFSKKYVWWSLGKVRTRKKNILNKVFDPLVNFLLKKSNCIMTRTSWAKKYYIEEKGIPENRVIIAPNSMDEDKARSEVIPTFVEELKLKYEGNRILYVGALTKEKRPKDLIDAYNYLLNNKLLLNNTYLWFVGAGPELDNLKKYTEQLGLNNNIIFFGKVFEGVGSYFEASDIVVVPGLGGLVINHAMIFGKPVVSGVADGTEFDLIEENISGHILKEDNIKTLALNINNVLKPENLERMSRAAKYKVDSFWNIKTMISRVEECIEYKS